MKLPSFCAPVQCSSYPGGVLMAVLGYLDQGLSLELVTRCIMCIIIVIPKASAHTKTLHGLPQDIHRSMSSSVSKFLTTSA